MKLIPTLLFGIATTGVSALVAERSNTPAPYHRPDSEHLVPEGYIVRFRPNHTMEDHITNLGFDIRQFASAFLEITLANSYMFHLTEANNSLVHDAIRHDPGVLRIEHDEYLHHEELGQMSTTGPRTDFVNKSKRWVSKVMRSHAPWNQVMISLGSKRNFGGESEVGKPFHSQFYLKNIGAGVNVYVLDTGIKIEHDTFQVDRSTSIASHFKGLKSSDVSPYCKFNDINRFMNDTLNHGTHVAGIIRSNHGGVVNKANLINVKMAKCGGTMATAEAAINDVVREHVHNKDYPPQGWRGSVINMSIGYRTTNYHGIADMLQIAKRYGIPVAAAAGNQQKDELEIPARFPSTFSVGAVDINYDRWKDGGMHGHSGSNYNKLLNIWAPGKTVWSAMVDLENPESTSKYDYASGTSMATPHVAGVMAIIMGYEGHSKLSAQDVYDRLNANAIPVVNLDEELLRAGLTTNLLQTGIRDGWDAQEGPYIIPSRNLGEDNVAGDESTDAPPPDPSRTPTDESTATVAPPDPPRTPTDQSTVTAAPPDPPQTPTADPATSLPPQTTDVDDTPMETHTPPKEDKDADEVAVQNDGTDPDSPIPTGEPPTGPSPASSTTTATGTFQTVEVLT